MMSDVLATNPLLGSACLGFFVSFGVVCLLTPLWIAVCTRLQAWQPIRSTALQELEGLHQEKAQTPTMGGLVMLVGVVIGALSTEFRFQPSGWIIAAGTLSMGALGALDDLCKVGKHHYAGLSPRRKLQAQGAMAVCLMLWILWECSTAGSAALFVPWWGPLWIHQTAGLGLLFCLGLFGFVGATNAVNLTDGMDGLASGLLLIAFLFLAGLASTLPGWVDPAISRSVMSWSCSAAGACGAFLLFNRHPARLFMGDVGSMGLGGCLISLALLMRVELLLVILGGCFVVETLSVVLQVWSFQKRGRRIFRCAPLHHHFEKGGISEWGVVGGFWMVGLILALVSLWAVL